MVELKIERLFESLFRKYLRSSHLFCTVSQQKRAKQRVSGLRYTGTVEGGSDLLLKTGGSKKSSCLKICGFLAFSFLSIPGTLKARITPSSQDIRRVFSGKFYQPNRKEWKTLTREFPQRSITKLPLHHLPIMDIHSLQITFLKWPLFLNMNRLPGSAFIW